MSLVGELTRRRLAQSVHLLESRKDRLLEALEAGFGTREAKGEDFGRAKAVARVLTGLLIEQGRNLVDWGELRVPGDALVEHRALGISGRHYSRFGDALVPVIRDVLGPGVPREIALAWCDAFWAAIGGVMAQAETAPASSLAINDTA